MQYDVAIVGSGPAAISAALNLRLHEKSIIWFGSPQLSPKVEKSHQIANYPGVAMVSGPELNRLLREQIEQMGLQITARQVTNIVSTRRGFMLQGGDEIYEAKTLLLATGAVSARDFVGEERLLGKGVSYCATCDGFLYKGKTIAIYCGAPAFEHEVVGSVDMDAILQKLDAHFSDFEYRKADFDIALQKPISGHTMAQYEIDPQEEEQQRAILTCGQLLGNYDDLVRNYAAAVLADYLSGDNDTPMKRAILDSGLGQDFGKGVRDGILQPWFSWEVWNTEAELSDEICRVLRQTAEHILSRGMDKQRLRSCFSQLAFYMRDKDGGSMPRSLDEALQMRDTWLYGGDPAHGLLLEPTLEALEKELV